MENPLRWTHIIFIITVTLNNFYISCQNQGSPLTPASVYKDCNNEIQVFNHQSSPTPQLMNTVLTLAAANGVLPELVPLLQPLRIVSGEMQPHETVQKTVTVTPLPHTTSMYPSELMLTATQPKISTTSHLNPTISPQKCPYSLTSSAPAPAIKPIVISPGLNQAQHSNPLIPRIPEIDQPPPVTLYPEPRYELYSCAPTEHFISTESFLSPDPINLQTSQCLPAVSLGNTAEIFNMRNELDSTCVHQGIPTNRLSQYDGPSPVNFYITIPTPNVEAPHITLINTLPATTSVEPSYSNYDWYSHMSYPAPQPIIIKKKQSSLNDWLPLILLALFNNDRGCSNGGCCCRNCNSGGSNTIPIPFPIPIPTSNSIINCE